MDSIQKRIWAVHELKVAIALVPKVACTSIRHALLPIAGRKSLSDSFHSWDFIPLDYAQIMPVRSPWERLRSFYCHNLPIYKKRGIKKSKLEAIGIHSDIRFHELATIVANTDSRDLDKHLKPQHLIFESRKWTKRPNICKLENLMDWWPRYNLPPIQHERKALIEKPKWTIETVERIRERYHRDIVLFNYEAPKV